MKRFLYLLIIFISYGLYCCNQTNAQQWDWHIASGTIVDGTGKKPYQADILIRADSIGYIGRLDSDTVRAENKVKANGKVITPGFIDMHAHGNPKTTPEFHNFLAMGVTTIVLGQDGSSPTVGKLNQWFADVEKANPSVNIALLSGHGSIRSSVGVGKQAPSGKELDSMQRLLEKDLESGAFGMSTGLEYVPGMYSEKAELKQMASVVGEHNGIVMSHMRSEDNSEIEASLDELAVQGEVADVHASHLKVVYGKGIERAEKVLNYINSFRQQGIHMTADIYPYAASYTGIGIVFPDWAKTESEWKNVLQERPEVLQQFLKDKIAQRNGAGAILFGSGNFAGLTLEQAAERENISPVDLLMEIGPEAASAAHFVMDPALQDRLLMGKGVAVSSDGSPTMHHPRGYGSFAKIIRYYVNEKELLSIEEAVHKMSGLPAKTLGLKDRGQLRKGWKADLLIFDPNEIVDRATFEHPHKLAEGFHWIMVNGTLVRDKGEFTGQSTGCLLKSQENRFSKTSIRVDQSK